METILNKIDKLTKEWQGLLPMKPEYQKVLDKKFRLEFNYNSNHLEGNTLTYSETALLLIFDDAKGQHSMREFEEMKAHDVAYNLIYEWAKHPDRPLHETSIKNLNEIILVRPFWKDAITDTGQKTRRLIKVGDYKEFPNSVQLQNGEMFEYESTTDTPILMGELMQWYRNELEKNEIHPVALAALFHYKFVRIHPFDDGNGRISRLLMNYVLLMNNLPPVVIKSADKQNYLSALNSADTGDLDTFIKYIATKLIWSLELSIRAAKGESIEEPDDVEKEIALWKKQATSKKVEALHRNDELIYEIYTKSVKEMFEQFDEKHKQFYDMFTKATCHTYKNSNGKAGIEWLSDEIDAIALKPHALFVDLGDTPETIIPEDTFKNIFIQVDLQEYKYSDKHPISIQSQLRLEFHPYTYEIKYADRKIRKNYLEFLDTDERNRIIMECIKSVFAEIKDKTK